MKEITYKITTKVNDDFGSALVSFPVFVCGYNEVNNAFSVAFPDRTLEDRATNNKQLIENVDFQYENNYFLSGMPGQTKTSFTYEVAGPKIFVGFVKLASSSDFRTPYQLMQDYAELKPTLNKITISVVQNGPTGKFVTTDELGYIYIGRSSAPFEERKSYFQKIRIVDYLKPAEGYVRTGDPQDFIQAVDGGGADFVVMPTIEIPVNMQLDGKTILGIDAPQIGKEFVAILMTLHFN
jgi:hypothetical protein